MPRPPRRSRKQQKKRRSNRRRNATKSEFASLKEVHTFDSLDANIAYKDYECSLARFQRASTVAKAYREYRITKVEYIFKALADTFNAGGASTVPQLYAMIDKTGTMANVALVEEFRRAGAKPRRFDDRNIRVTFKPAALQFAYDKNHASNTWAIPKTSPWLSCDKNNDSTLPWAASSIDHLGLVWIQDQQGAAPTQYVVEMVAHFQFRKPTAEFQVSDETVESGHPTASIQV